MPAHGGPTLTIGGKEYDVNRDFSWRELLTVEELGGVPLAQTRPDPFESMGVLAAFVFVVMKRDDETLTWEAFLNGSVADLTASDGPEGEPSAKAAAKKRPPTKQSA